MSASTSINGCSANESPKDSFFVESTGLLHEYFNATNARITDGELSCNYALKDAGATTVWAVTYNFYSDASTKSESSQISSQTWTITMNHVNGFMPED